MAENIDPQFLSRVENAVGKLAKREYPPVWIGEPGMTPEYLFHVQNSNEAWHRELWEQMTRREKEKTWEEMPEGLRERLPDDMYAEPPEKWNDLPGWLREEMRHPLDVEPGEFVQIEGTGSGIQIPNVSYKYLNGLWVIENMCHLLDDAVEAELHTEVLYIYAAKRGMVPLIEDSWERFAAGIAPDITLVPIKNLRSCDVRNILLEDLEFYVEEPETMGPYVIEDSEEARGALEERLGS